MSHICKSSEDKRKWPVLSSSVVLGLLLVYFETGITCDAFQSDSSLGFLREIRRHCRFAKGSYVIFTDTIQTHSLYQIFQADTL